MQNIIRYLLIVILALFMVSCMQNMRMARKYVIDKPFKPVIILPPTDVIKSVYPSNPDHYESTPPERLEISDSKFLAEIDADEIINRYMKAITNRLKRYGYTVYGPDDISKFLSSGEKVFVFSVAQLEIMEYPDTLRPSFVYNYVYYEQAIMINTLVQNTWIEFSELNHPDRPMNVLFSMQHTADYIDGNYRYDWNTNSVIYEYTPYRIVTEDLYRLGEFSGYQAAQYIYDFLMNIYITDKTGKPFNVNDYLILDRERRMIRKADSEERFFIIKLQEKITD